MKSRHRFSLSLKVEERGRHRLVDRPDGKGTVESRGGLLGARVSTVGTVPPRRGTFGPDLRVGSEYELGRFQFGKVKESKFS